LANQKQGKEGCVSRIQNSKFNVIASFCEGSERGEAILKNGD